MRAPYEYVYEYVYVQSTYSTADAEPDTHNSGIVRGDARPEL